MRSLSLLAIITMSTMAQITPQVIVGTDAAKEYRINTADDNSLRTRTAIIPFTHIKVAEISGLIRKQLSVYGNVTLNTVSNELIVTDEVRKLENIVAVCKSLDKKEMENYQARRSERIAVQYGKASELAGVLANFLTSEGSISVDNNFNALIVTDHPEGIAKVQDQLKKFDAPQKQVVIDVEIVEVEWGKLEENGIDWDKLLSSTWINASTHKSGAEAISNILVEKEGSTSQKIAGIEAGISVDDLSSVIKFMQEKGGAKILATPKLVTVTGKQASLWYGEDIRERGIIPINSSRQKIEPSGTYGVVSRVQNHADSANSPYSGSYSYNANTTNYPANYSGSSLSNVTLQRTAGLDLRITPTLGESDLVSLDFNCELTSIRSWTPQGNPLVTGQEINSSLIGKIGKPLLIGGLKRTTTVEKKKRIPGLGHILPFLFSRTVSETKETELAILLTPKVVDLSTVVPRPQVFEETAELN